MGPLYLLDTNAASDLFSSRSAAARQNWLQARKNGRDVAISTLSHGELLFGFLQNPAAVRLRSAYDDFLKQVSIVPWTEEASVSYATLRLHLKKKSKVVYPIDLLIASQAHALNATLVSRDKVFRYVEDVMEVVNWATDLVVHE